MRIAVGRFWTESSSMSPLLANRAMFEAGALVEGEAFLPFFRGTRTEVGGFLAALDAAGVEPVPLLGAQAACAGPIERDFWLWLCERMTSLLREAGAVDAVLLSLHGATLAVDEDDCCGALLAAVRTVVGPTVPIAATLDMHGNPTHRMADAASALVAYKTYPHHDFVERGRQAAAIALAAARGEVRPVTAVTTIPLQLGSLPLMNELIARGVEIERQPGVLCCSIMPTHPMLDVAEFHHLSAVVVTDGDRERARRLGADLMWEAWRQRERAVGEAPRLIPLPDGIHQALAYPPGTVVVADRLDAVTGGFPGDSAEIVRCLLDLGVREPACIILTDPGFVELAERTGIGGTVSGPLGGRWGSPWYGPLPVTARVRVLSDGTLQKSREPRPGHLEISNTSMGKTAVVEIAETITAVATSVPVMSTEPTVYRSVGVEPYDYRIVVTKSVNQQRFHYPEAVGFVDLGGPGWGNATTHRWTRRPPLRVFPEHALADDEIRRLLDRAGPA
jgi:microcystin degradation protein MlrC